ncbi:MAG TPA: ABC transporter permease [Vicinamibacterales bacterium]|nr:ABC transporter permease [Vicinamibacterales bacterium]
MSIVGWLRRLMRRGLDERDFQDEVRAHLAIAADERVADGADRETARYAALKDFGNVTLATEEARRVWTPSWVDALRDQVSDVRYAIRALARNPGFALTVSGVLTLGIGLNATAFTMLKSFALTPLAGVDRSADLVVVFGQTSAGRQLALSYPDYVSLRDHDASFSPLFGTRLVTAGLGRGRGARSMWAELVTGNFFQALGVRAELGRTLLPSDEVAPGQPPIVVLSDGLWRRDFGADTDIIGKSVEINHRPLTVVGVADASFHGTIVSYDVEAFIPVMMGPDLGVTFGSRETTPAAIFSDREAAVVFPHGRLRSGTTIANAGAEANAIWATRASERPLSDAAQHLSVVRFWQSPTGGQTYMLPTLVVLSVMGLFVLMIACANIAGLVLVRGVSRRGELGLRLALGASRARIVRLLVAETIVLALPSAALGVVLARRGIPILVSYAAALAAPARLYFNVDIDAVVLAFSVLVAFACALVFGFMPALRSSRIDLLSVMKEDLGQRGGGRNALRAGLVVSQVAVSVLLLVGAGLVSRSAQAARAAYPGFDANDVTTTAMDVTQNAYDETRGRTFYRELLKAARADAGVEAATLAAFEPMALIPTPGQDVEVEGYQRRLGEDASLMFNAVASDYFRTLRIGLVRGRAFGDHDDETAAPVAIVNNTMAERFWGSADNAVGKRIRVGAGDWRSVVGVASDVKYLRLSEPPRPYVYVPFLQSYRTKMVLHTRGTAPMDALVDLARGHVASLDIDLPVLYSRALKDRVQASFVFFDFAAVMLLTFGTAGIALAAMGTYGLVSYAVRQQTHEIGIRMALGASGAAVVRGFLGRGLRLGATGAVLGIVLAFGLSRLLGGVLYGVSATDVVSFARALVIVLGGVILATVVPAWRASRTDPLRALRHQ